jgi:Ca-activated chloride channel family protein
MDQFLERIRHPALSDLAIDWGGMKVSDLFPDTLPDLFVGRPVVVTGRFDGQGPHTLRVTGRAGPDRLELRLPVDLDELGNANAALPSIWARMKIADLYDRSTYSHNPFLHGQIKQLALDYNLMSAYTAFVAVDSSARTAGHQGTTVPVPVPVPEGVKYRTTVEE